MMSCLCPPSCFFITLPHVLPGCNGFYPALSRPGRRVVGSFAHVLGVFKARRVGNSSTGGAGRVACGTARGGGATGAGGCQAPGSKEKGQGCYPLAQGCR